jgi:beta-1,4-mannosyl-glycoprotein beta-1,4-N-acetylglucosaminyltransferase
MIWSATPYCGEADILEIRLATLDPVVDVHVLVEGNVTQRGNPKPFHFLRQKARFRRWMDKIRYLPVNLAPDQGLEWERERAQRDAALGAMTDVRDSDVVLLSDLDEIPRPETVTAYPEPVKLQMDMHVYFLNWRWPERPVRYGARATVVPGVMLPEKPSYLVEAGFALRNDTCGWHLAYQMDAEGIRDKILNIADDFRQPEFLDLEHIEYCRRTGADVFRRGFRQAYWCPDSELPPYARRAKFAHLRLPEPVSEAA